MSDINKAILRVAKQNPVFAKALQAELTKTAQGLPSGQNLPTRDGSVKSYGLAKNPGVWAHVWFDKDVAQTDFGNRAPHSGEWQVIITTSEDPLNRRPRGRELAREVFRYVEKKTESQVYAAAKTYVQRQLSQRRRLANTASLGDDVDRALKKLVKVIQSKDPKKVDQRSLDSSTDGEILADVLAGILQGTAMSLDDARGFRKRLKF
jgi:hypothetical protein